MKIAVTGASGFIGRHVLKELNNKGFEVTALTRDVIKFENDNLNINIVQMDISNPPENAYKIMGSPDTLIHLSWDGLPNFNSCHHFESELPAQYSFLKKIIEAGVSTVLVTGTCFEYGMQSGQLSEDIPLLPNNSYGFAKATLCRQLEFLKKITPFKLIWARLFYMYGEGQAISSLYPKLEEAVKMGRNEFNLSGGEQLRDYMAVEDIANIIVKLVKIDQDIGKINICSGHPISVRKLVEKWLSENNWKMNLNLGYYPYLSYEPMAFWGARAKLDKFLDT